MDGNKETFESFLWGAKMSRHNGQPEGGRMPTDRWKLRAETKGQGRRSTRTGQGLEKGVSWSRCPVL